MTRWLAALAAAVMLGGLMPVAALADVNSVTPSTNDANRSNGWAYVDVVAGPGTATMTFHSTRSFYSCFEYRTDGDTSQRLTEHGGNNYNTQITDGLYPYDCVSNSTDTLTVSAQAYVEIRMVFGAETDERFDWTRFEVLPKCTPTGLVRDGIDLTAAVIDPATAVTGVVDATGCNIGVYFGPGATGSVQGAEVFGANYYGVVANAADVDVMDASIHDIGESPLNGAQHGIGVLYTTVDQAGHVTGAAATGMLRGTRIAGYQKGGVVVSGHGAAVRIRNNVVIGQGAVNWIAQNGIQVSYGATALIRGNRVVGNRYTPKAWVACGLLYYQAGGVRASRNHLRRNEVNVCNVGRGGGRFLP
jgi:hypothetical protein